LRLILTARIEAQRVLAQQHARRGGSEFRRQLQVRAKEMAKRCTRLVNREVRRKERVLCAELIQRVADKRPERVA
jgi:hypothetical protein